MRRPSPHRSWLLASIALAVALTGCPGPDPDDAGPPLDAGPPIELDGGPRLDVDTDEDGLCDGTELSMGTDPTSTDSDADGLTDRIEVELGFRPLEPGSPDRDILMFMEETELATAQRPIPLTVRGDGHTYTGAFEALPVFDTLDLTALDYLVTARAVGADPMENVFEVLETEQRFVGVFGRTQLVWEVRFAFGSNLPRSCIRAYPFRYLVKRDDGYFVGVSRLLLVILPDGQRLDTAEWCRPEGPCI